MTTVMAPLCCLCTHLHRSEVTGLGLIPMRCDAYPKGIPGEILLSRVDHRQPHEGDHTVLFEPRDKQAAAYARVLFTVRDTGE